MRGSRLPLRIACALLFPLTLGACGARGTTQSAAPAHGAALARPLEIYRELGFLTGSGQFPAVASLAALAGPADSTFLLIAMSLPNSALRFLREDEGFRADYAVELLFLAPDSSIVRRETRRESVRVAAFAETARSDESVVFQHLVTLAPGRYSVRLNTSDVNSARGFSATDTLTVPAYGEHGADIASPVIVYEATGRADRHMPPSLIVNPRGTVPYATSAAKVYLESYGASPAASVRVIDEHGTELWSTRASFDAARAGVRHALVEVPAERLPLGRFWLEVAGARPERRPLVLTISDQWMVANFGDVLQFLQYIAHPDELAALRAGSPEEQRRAWDEFWSARDPLPTTGVNEYRDQFFQRVRYATEAFREGSRAGWQTQRGEVYIVLGPPDRVAERYMGRTNVSSRPNAEEWVYNSLPGGRLRLVFHDRTGAGSLTLVPASASAFRDAAERLRPPPPAGTER